MCETNKSNRARGGAPHRTGRKSFARLRKEIMENGEKTDRVSMFVKTRAMKTRNDDGQPIEVHDEEATAVISQFNEYLRDMPEDEQNDTFREEVFTTVMGEDTHGRVRMYGIGVTPSQVFGNSKTSETTEKKTIEEMEKKYQTKLDDLKESHESQLGDMKLKYEDVSNRLNLLMAHVGIQVNQSGSTSEQQLRRTIDGHHQLDLEGQQ
ncbi:putative transposase, Ptta/En/Spm, plant [Rosa chinensis]|uniref:Putative transposase, Ptta/En/Spm, plant n=1 Tax=Rosa chinensis TaxID=74649 RepID=A0A2P6Q007_ROSCH|nr:putative transposase, Ptta/En/Spm, plant [Rosa chinensis]